MSQTFLWIEDRKGKSGYNFWKVFLKTLYPDIILESKINNSELIKAVKSLQDNENKYIIILDNSFDNSQIVSEHKYLRNLIKSKENVFLVNVICFEYILLEFEYLTQWVFAPDDELRVKREKALLARKELVSAISSGNMNYKTFREIIDYDQNIDSHNIEQLSARLLFDITRNTGFEVSKKNIGECWINSCCEWKSRQNDDICGLDNRRIDIREKMSAISERTGSLQRLAQLYREAVL
ncbi:hypothetical protein [Ruminococcus sp. HUN007]|uniref:hypothetical protein n=1 Tax=Ruminococcus sp. HUN007 TaxID=1514668 RepID=UPI0005D1EF8A|nr:hypothetical protein [Ruminococcus sp. HUN007]